ncbi:unnamed protein product [Calicophoron daubneyi]|uniref:G8 domain-containing protein n=1 Tax=Calicophoron daubneyi TaxID=300641 RepID=A0AAV2TE92_CALDB
MFCFYPVFSVTPKLISTTGGADVEIKGDGFSNYSRNVKVYIGEHECHPEIQNNSYIRCILSTIEEFHPSTAYPGDRDVEFTLEEAPNDGNAQPRSGHRGSTLRAHFWFIPPYHSEYAFVVRDSSRYTFQASTFNQTMIKEAYMSFATSHCPKRLLKPQASKTAFLEDFEDPSTGVLEEAFCGRRCVKNKHFLELNPNIDLNKYPYLCYAFKGQVSKKIRLMYKTSGKGQRGENTSFVHEDEYLEVDESRWNYRCVDVLKIVRAQHSKDVVWFQLVGFGIIPRTNYWNGYTSWYTDTIYIGSEPMDEDPQDVTTWPRFSSHTFDDLNVQLLNESRTFTIEMISNYCKNGFSLFGTVTPSVELVYSYTNGSTRRQRVDERIISQTEWIQPNYTMAPEGFVTLSFQGIETAPIPISPENGDAVQRILSVHPLLHGVRVRSRKSCNNFAHEVLFVAQPGSQPLLKVANRSMFTGNDAEINIHRVQEGHTLLCPIPRSMMAKVYEAPQVRVYVDGQPASCSNSCSQNFSDAVAPIVDRITENPEDGLLVVEGKNFDGLVRENNEMILLFNGHVHEQLVAGMSMEGTLVFQYFPSNSLSCGVIEYLIRVRGRGVTKGRGIISLPFKLRIRDVSSKVNTSDGRLQLSIYGRRICTDNLIVLVAETKCEITAHNRTAVICSTEQSANFVGPTLITLIQNGIHESKTIHLHHHNESLIPMIDRVNPSENLPLMGGTNLTITGQKFEGKVEVFIGGKIASNFLQNSTTILVEAPEQDTPGTKLVLVFTDSTTSSRDNITVNYAFELRELSVSYGSWLGGQIVRMTGTGFTEEIRVVFNSFEEQLGKPFQRRSAQCTVKALNASELTCEVGTMSMTHYVRNTGNHEVYGRGYSWEPAYLDIVQGDSVTWEWESPVAGKPIGVYEIGNLSDLHPISGGFKTPLAYRGSFSVFFPKPGEYYYSSANSFVMTGLIRVRPIGDYLTKVIVYDPRGREATHVNVQNKTFQTDETICGLSGKCRPLIHEAQQSRWHMFAFRECTTPTFTNFSPKEGTLEDVLTFHIPGQSFCQRGTRIRVGGIDCVQAESMKATEGKEDIDIVRCSINRPQHNCSGFEAGKGLIPEVNIPGLGIALLTNLMDIHEREYVWVPLIRSNTEVQRGSVLGEGVLSIEGMGFDRHVLENNQIILGEKYACPVTFANFTHATCIIPVLDDYAMSETKKLSVDVQIHAENGVYIKARKVGQRDVTYTLDPNLTPYVTDVQPRYTNRLGVVNITGKHLLGENPDTIRVTATIGPALCSLLDYDLKLDSFRCSLNQSLPPGNHTLVVSSHPWGRAYVPENISIISRTDVTDISPLTGYLFSTQLITVTGNGLDDSSFKISIGTNECKPVADTIISSRLVCSVHLQPEHDLPFAFYEVDILWWTSSQPAVKIPTAFKVLSPTGPEARTENYDTTVSSEELSTPCAKFPQDAMSDTLCHSPHTSNPTEEESQSTYSSEENTLSSEWEVDDDEFMEGSLFGGNAITFTRKVKNNRTSEVYICERLCEEMELISPTEIFCVVPTPSNTTDQECPVKIVTDQTERTLPRTYRYTGAKTPRVSSISPLITRAGESVLLTISGENFGSKEGTVVVVAGSELCSIVKNTNNTITCLAPAHPPRARVPLRVYVLHLGHAAMSTDYVLQYDNCWSFPEIWGDTKLPKAGDVVEIGPSKEIMLDTNTPILSMLLINGGVLRFDAEKPVHLNAKNILITNGGRLEIGTEENPHKSKATITLYGHAREKQLPLFGSKVLAVNNGSLTIFGEPPSPVWTKLAQTAEVGSLEIALIHPVNWKSGDKIIITSTGTSRTADQNEEHVIHEVGADKLTVILKEPLRFRKLGRHKEPEKSIDLHLAAEVGLLTRNVLIQGDVENSIPADLEQCLAGDETDHLFIRETCVAGNPSEQLGADKHGGHIFIGGTKEDDANITVQLANIELYNMGQSFRLGRHPIHFHHSGQLEGSYVRNCSVHRSFNRAINLHNTQDVVIDYNVVYDVLGCAICLEGGSEVRNVISHNLVVGVKASTSHLPNDLTPASFCINNTVNIVKDNVAAGGYSTGFLYGFLHPRLPTDLEDYSCSTDADLAQFVNNTAHSLEGSGFWITGIHQSPRDSKTCTDQPIHTELLDIFSSWNNAIGFRCDDCGGAQISNVVSVNNSQYAVRGHPGPIDPLRKKPTIYKDVTIVQCIDTDSDADGGCTNGGMLLPASAHVVFLNLKVYSSPDSRVPTFQGIAESECGPYCSGYEYLFEGVRRDDPLLRVQFARGKEYSLRDTDGSLLSGIPGVKTPPNSLVVPIANHLPMHLCRKEMDFISNAVICPPSMTAIRFFIKSVKPSMKYDLLIAGIFEEPFEAKKWERIKFSPGSSMAPGGWATTLISGHTYLVSWEDPWTTPSNFSYTAEFGLFTPGDYVIIRHTGLPRKPDKVRVIPGQDSVFSSNPLTEESNDKGDVYYSSSGGYLEYIALCTKRIEGTLIFQQSFTKYLTFNVAFKQMLIYGGAVYSGTDADGHVFRNGTINLIVKGSPDDHDQFKDIPGPIIGPKSIAVFGTLCLIGDPDTTRWTRIRETATAGTNTLQLEEPVVNWKVGDRVLVTATGSDYLQSEVHKIQSIDGTRTMITLENPLKYTHTAHSSTLGSEHLNIRAEVALLSSNINIIGDEQSKVTKFGGRVLVSKNLIENVLYPGDISLSGVHLRNMGQPAFADDRLPLAIKDTGHSRTGTGLTRCIIEDSYTTAVGVYGSNDWNLTDNVIYNSAGAGMDIHGEGHYIARNLIVQTNCSQSLRTPDKLKGALDTSNARYITLAGNAIAGAQCLCLRVGGQECESESTWTKQVVHSCPVGIAQITKLHSCTRLDSAIVYSTSLYGVYWRVSGSVEASQLRLIDNAVGIYPVLRDQPSIDSNHIFSRSFTLTDAYFVGNTTRQECFRPLRNFASSTSSREARTAIMATEFGYNFARLEKMVINNEKIHRSTTFTNVAFINYTTTCTSEPDRIWRDYAMNEDGLQTVIFANTTWTDEFMSAEKPVLKNQGYCGDIDCRRRDMVVFVINGSDGGQYDFLSTNTYLMLSLPPSDEQSGPDNQTGGNGLRGNVQEISEVFNGTEMYSAEERDPSDEISAQRILLIKSLEPDTVTRKIRLFSFIEMTSRGEVKQEVSGTANVSECRLNNSCERLINVFPVIVQNFTKSMIRSEGAAIQNLFFILLSQRPDFVIRLGMFIHEQYRLDVFVDGKYVLPKNAGLTAEGLVQWEEHKREDEHYPSLESDPSGANYHDEKKRVVFFNIRGPEPVQTRAVRLIQLILEFSLPISTKRETDSLVISIANFLGLSCSHIRLVKPSQQVSTVASHQNRVRISKRTQHPWKVEFDIADQPAEVDISKYASDGLNLEDVHAKLIAGIQNGAIGQANTVPYNSAPFLSSKNKRKVYEMYAALNKQIQSAQITKPPPKLDFYDVNHLAEEGGTSTAFQNIQLPHELKASLQSTVLENIPFTISLEVTDKLRNFVRQGGFFVLGQTLYRTNA